MSEGGAVARGAGGAAGPGIRHAHAYVEGVGGVRLFYRSWKRADASTAVVMVHGMGDHSGRWAEVAGGFTAAGLSAVALDLRGHGRSRGRRGHAASFEHLLRDLDRVRRVAATGPVDRVVLLGHSLGGLVVLRHLQAFPSPAVLGAVAVAPFLRLRVPVPGWKLALGRMADRWLPGLTLDSELDRDLLHRQEDARERHRRDPLVHRRISARLWGEMQREARALEANPRTGKPVLLQVAGDDRVVDPEAVEALGRRLEPEARVRVYPPAYHDLYHDPEGPDALEDALAWIRSRLADPA